MVCGYISKENPYEDKFAWSCLIYKIREAIENAGIEVKWIPFKDEKGNFIANCVLHLLSFPQKVTGHTPWAFRNKAESIDNKLLSMCDFLFIPSGSEIIPYIKTKLPIIVYGDATYSLMNNYYFKNVSPFQLWLGNQCERNAIKRAEVVCKASHWAINSVINDYLGDKNHSYVLEFGANIDERDITPIIPWNSTMGELNILFSGVDWNRKGGDIAYML